MIVLRKEIYMSRLSRFLLLPVLVVFALACNFVMQPVRDAQEAVSTVQSVASSMPLETLQAIASAMPASTIEAISSALPDFGNMFNPQGEPVAEWNGIPIMPQATAGQEHDANNYSFKFTGTVKEAQDFYDGKMKDLGWSSMFSMPGDANGAVLVFQKDNKLLTLTIATADNNSTVVILTMA
jgi:hypothetical protein